MSRREPNRIRRPRNVPHAGARERNLAEETNERRRRRRFGDPSDSGPAGRGRVAGAAGSWPTKAKRIGGRDLAEPGRPAICFLYEDLQDLAELEGPAQVFGMYPQAFIAKILPWLKCDRRRLVHVCSGGLPRGEGIRVDLRAEAQPDVRADGRALPFRTGSVEAVLLDPPYTEHYARDLYGVAYPRPSHLLREAARVVKPCGRIGFVHYITPNPPPLLQGCEGLRSLDRLRLPDAGGHPLRARPGRALRRGARRVTNPDAQLWRIIEGDCREVLRSLPEASVDVCVTDPPYGETALEWDRRVDGWLPAVMRVLKPHGSLWCFGSLRFFMERAADFAGWRLAQDIVWEKHNGSGFDADRFKRVHELAAQFYPAAAAWASIYRAPQRVPGEARPASHAVRARASVDHRRAIGAHGYEYSDERLMRSVLRVRSCHHRAVHPTQKPEGILEPLIRYSCPPGGLVLDPFAGSGSAGLAAQRAGMRFLGIEIDPTYAALARRRLAGDVVGDAPLLAGGGSP